MSSPNGSIANLAVTRKTLAGGTARSRIPRALRAASRLDSRAVACALRRKRGNDENRSRRTENKKAGAFEGAGVGSMRSFSPR
jgi:hypothetical protein